METEEKKVYGARTSLSNGCEVFVGTDGEEFFLQYVREDGFKTQVRLSKEAAHETATMILQQMETV
jgi:hypothetical protein